MQHRRTGWVSAAVAAVLVSCAAGSGCNTIPFSAPPAERGNDASVARAAGPQQGGGLRTVAATPGVLRPRTEVVWFIETPGSPPSGGPATVGPDGSLDLGPYGQFPVAGLTADQARARIERQLGRQYRNPKVQLRLSEVTPAADWGSSTPAPQQQPARQAPAQAVKSVWRPVQRENASGTAPAIPTRNNEFGTAAASRPARPSGWQPAGAIQRVGDTGPELAPPPQAITGNPPQGLLVAPPAGMPHGAPLGPPVGPPVIGAPHGPVIGPGPMPGPMPGPGPMVHHTPFGVGHAPWEGHKLALPPYVIAPPDILQIESVEGLLTQPVRGPHLVRPDGTVSLGIHGSAFVAGMTIDQARVEIAKALLSHLNPTVRTLKDILDGLSVDVLAYNSRVYYVITNRLGFGTIVDRLPVTGSETVLDAISQLRGLPPESSKRRIWVARKVPGHSGGDNILPVDWVGITQKGEMKTNYQLLPGDRVFVQAEGIQRTDWFLSKWLSPIQRLFGATLLGSETVNSIRLGAQNTGGTAAGAVGR